MSSRLPQLEGRKSRECNLSTVLLTSLTVGWRESVVRPGNSQMEEGSEMLTAVGLGSEDVILQTPQQIYFPENQKQK